MIAPTFESELDDTREERWRAQARCRDGQGSLTELFFSENLDDIARAKEFCAECPVRTPCLAGALARQEPWGVWGGQLVWKGRIVARKRRRGRPPLPRDPATGEIVRDPARAAELRRASALEAERELAEVAELVAEAERFAASDGEELVARSA